MSSSFLPLVDLHAQHAPLKEALLSDFADLLERGDYILGAAVADFENAFAGFIGAKHAVGVASGLDALRIALEAAKIGPGDEVILPANTFIATALAVSQTGATPRLVDCEPSTFLIDTRHIAAAITERTRAIIPVHLTGHSADMDVVQEIAYRHGLAVIEDAAQAHGARYNGKSCGSMSLAGCFSFYPAKNLGGCGDGGMLVTSNDEVAAYARCARHYGQRARYDHVIKGGNSRLDTIQALILGRKLPLLEGWNAARARHAEHYRKLLSNVGDLVLQKQAEHSTHVYHLFIIQTEHRDALQKWLRERQIDTGIHYPIPVHLQEAYKDLGYKPGDFPCAERLSKHMLSIPLFAEMTNEQVERVAAAIREFFDRH